MLTSSSLILAEVLLCITSASAQTTVYTTLPPSLPSNEPEWTESDTFTSAVLDAHNMYRSDHDASDLRWNDTLADSSESYLDSDGSGSTSCPDFEHSDEAGSVYGENLALGHMNATQAVEAWGDERDMYDFDDGGFDEETGHFTAMVWQNTTDVGCARKFCDVDGWEHRSWYLVCHYWPPGNVQDQFEDQVRVGSYEGPEDDDSGASARATAWGVVFVAAGLASWMVL